MRCAFAIFVVSIGSAFPNATASAGDWPQFRGVNASGQAVDSGKLPADISPSSHVVWKAPLPPGHASPVIFGPRIYINAVENDRLLVMALDRVSGGLLWKTEIPHDRLEEIHRIGSHAQCTPTTDGERVVSFFGSAGLFCHDTEGNLLWNRPMGPFKNTFGAGSSPIIVDDYIVLCQDHDTDSFLMALDKRTGNPVWTTDRSEFPRNYSTPVIWNVSGKKQVVVAATLRVVGYEFETGKELWTVRGIARFVSATPVIGPDNTLYVAGWAAGGDEGGIRFEVPAFDDVVAELDKDNNGTLEESELPDGGPIRMRFVQVDRDKNGSLTREEYDYFRTLFRVGKNVVIAVKPGGSGDVSQTHVLWTHSKHVPFCASPVIVDGRFFSVKDGGIVSCLSAATGTAYKQSRVEATGEYYSSPVAGNGKLYLVNEQGQLTVISTAADWQVLHAADFEENVYATPAIVDGKIYLRTAGHLYCFGE
jgi:outer membrane protein assembly factor BamB